MSNLNSFVISFFLYTLVLFGFSFVLQSKKDNMTYTDNQSILRLIQGNINASGDNLEQKRQNINTEPIEKQEKTNEIQANTEKTLYKPSQNLNTQINEEEKFNENFNSFDPFESLDIKKPIKNNKKNENDKKLKARQELIKKTIARANNSLSDIKTIKNIKNNNANSGKYGNSNISAMPGKYDAYYGSINRRLNDIWSLYRPKNENQTKLIIKINLSGYVEVMKIIQINDDDFMEKINMFLDKIKKENFGIPPNNQEFIMELILQTNQSNININSK